MTLDEIKAMLVRKEPPTKEEFEAACALVRLMPMPMAHELVNSPEHIDWASEHRALLESFKVPK